MGDGVIHREGEIQTGVWRVRVIFDVSVHAKTMAQAVEQTRRSYSTVETEAIYGRIEPGASRLFDDKTVFDLESGYIAFKRIALHLAAEKLGLALTPENSETIVALIATLYDQLTPAMAEEARMREAEVMLRSVDGVAN